ncbi:hypothetical protein K488DRAFT_40886 [Vararia minispora EC-137]|uniref:Uncharacterized protein n=1 Tax=Vararia minispora EC-137 TaxID=1314806 RepID=A0ACB8QXK4_9AGAM|nr:hypothetical protein K488DRAFT_40886 [Vararia minispora EC-137]
MRDGYVVIKGAFPREKAEAFAAQMWVRLGMDPVDKTTWTQERVHMPALNREPVSTFAPKAWGAMLDLLGGEERVEEKSGTWGDSFIVNLGTDALEGQEPMHPRDLDNWHVDGDFFVHFLDSPEQALLVIPLFSDIRSRAGATYIAPDGIDLVARYLAQHPEGVLPTGRSFTPSTSTYERPADHPHHFSHLAAVRPLDRFVELTGDVGDVVLLHPLMLHTASKNHLRVPRVITNPPVALRAPFCFARHDPAEYSLVERKTLKALGVDRFEFEAATARREVVPMRVQIQRRMMEEERKRLEAARVEMERPGESTGVPVVATA